MGDSSVKKVKTAGQNDSVVKKVGSAEPTGPEETDAEHGGSLRRFSTYIKKKKTACNTAVKEEMAERVRAFGELRKKNQSKFSAAKRSISNSSRKRKEKENKGAADKPDIRKGDSSGMTPPPPAAETTSPVPPSAPQPVPEDNRTLKIAPAVETQKEQQVETVTVAEKVEKNEPVVNKKSSKEPIEEENATGHAGVGSMRKITSKMKGGVSYIRSKRSQSTSVRGEVRSRTSSTQRKRNSGDKDKVPPAAETTVRSRTSSTQRKRNSGDKDKVPPAAETTVATPQHPVPEDYRSMQGAAQTENQNQQTDVVDTNVEKAESKKKHYDELGSVEEAESDRMVVRKISKMKDALRSSISSKSLSSKSKKRKTMISQKTVNNEEAVERLHSYRSMRKKKVTKDESCRTRNVAGSTEVRTRYDKNGGSPQPINEDKIRSMYGPPIEETMKDVPDTVDVTREARTEAKTEKPKQDRPLENDTELRFILEEGNDMIRDHAKTLTRDELIMLDNYYRRSRHLRQWDKLSTSKDTYTCMTTISEGRFSAVFLVEATGRDDYMALKTEVKRQLYQKRVKNELMFLSMVQKSGSAFSRHNYHFPRLIDMGRSGEFIFIVLTLLGSHLEKVRKDLGGSFQKMSALYIMFETIKAVRDVHAFHYIHRDIKLTNFCIGFGEKYGRIYIIDFGSAKRFEMKERKSNSLMGSLCADETTLYYASVDVHKGEPPCRRTDLESWFYMCCDLLAKDSLPWKKEKNDRTVCEMKEKFLKESGGDYLNSIPFTAQFKEILEHITSLKHSTEPDYKKIRDLVKKCVEQTGSMNEQFKPEWSSLVKN